VGKKGTDTLVESFLLLQCSASVNSPLFASAVLLSSSVIYMVHSIVTSAHLPLLLTSSLVVPSTTRS
jgi:hypothetical protein